MTVEEDKLGLSDAVGVHPLSERTAALAVELGDDRAEVMSQFLAQLANAIDEKCQKQTSALPAASNGGTNASTSRA